MAMLPKLKLKALVNFPANVYGGTGIDVSKTNGNFTINLDYSEFPTTGTLPPNTNALVWDPVTDTYYLVPPSSVGGISDAPSDSKMYGRKNATWVDAWASPVLTGNPTAPTPTAGDSDTSIATTAFVASAVSTVTITGGVTYTPQSPTVSQQTIARQNVYAAPFDALAYSGMQINGSMEVSQENGTGTIDTSGTFKYVVDGWKGLSIGPQVAFCKQHTVAPPGYTASMQIYINATGNPSPAGNHACIFLQSIEGYRIIRLAWGTASAQPITIGFWVFANRVGMYSGSVRNGVTDRSYAFTFNVVAGSTWEYKTVTISGDTAGAWPTNNLAGMHLTIAMMAGATYQTTPGSWVAGNFMGATGTINGAAAGTDFMMITGLVVLPGIEAPTAKQSPLIMRPYDQEWPICRRYLQYVGPGMIAKAADATQIDVAVKWEEMRAPPTGFLNDTSLKFIPSNGSGVTASGAAFTFTDTISGAGGSWRINGFSGLTAGTSGWVNGIRTIKLDARL